MIGKRRLRVVYLLGSLLALAASLHAPTAYAAPGDPPTGSPAGAVYQLPLEQGRAEGAPKGGDGTGAGGGGAGQGGGGGAESESGSLYRSENNFGSSSHVPGVAAGGGGSGGGPTSGGGGAASGGGSAVPGGSGTAAAAGAAAGAAIGAGAAAGNGNTSVPGSIVLLAAIALLAAAVGVLSRRFARGRAEPTR